MALPIPSMVLKQLYTFNSLRNTADGLASSLHMAGTGAQGSLWARLRELNMPVLAIAGARAASVVGRADVARGADSMRLSDDR